MKSAEEIVKELAEETDIYYWGESVKEELAQKFRNAHADAMRAAAQVGRATLCGMDTTIPEFRESMVRRIEACADAAAKGFPTPGLVRIGPNVFMRDGETKPEEGGA